MKMNSLNFKDLDLAFVDTETTGRGLEHELIEIAVIRASGYNFSILDEWEAKIQPKKIELAEEGALKVNHYSGEAWKDAIPLEEAMKKFLEKTEKTILTAHNLNFDWYYIMKALEECGLKATFWFKGLDTISLAWMKLRQDPRIKFLSVKELCRYFDINQEKPHSALDDARVTYQMFKKILEI